MRIPVFTRIPVFRSMLFRSKRVAAVLARGAITAQVAMEAKAFRMMRLT
jgi:hypothetical protein